MASATHGRLKLPHYSSDQHTTAMMATVAWFSGTGQRPIDKLEPGDVITMNVPLSLGYDNHPWNHTAMYIGDGMVIHAEHPGTVVKVANLATDFPWEWAARRPLAKYTNAGK